MASGAISSYGTIIAMGPVGQSLTAIAEVLDISGPSIETRTKEVTPHTDGGAGYVEKIATLIDPGQVTFDVNLIPDGTSHLALLTAAADRDKRDFSITFPDTAATVYTFSGFVTSYGIDAPVEGSLSASITIDITAAITVA